MERRIFNGFIDRRPRALIFPESQASLVAAAKLLLERSEKFSVRAGGHNVAGSSLIDDGYVLDTSRLAHVSVDRERMVADVQPGALWRDFDSTCAKFQLCTPGGIVSDTGVAGLTLGGGIGWLNGLYGLSCDNLIEADVLLSNGEIVTAAETSNFDLLWALRGGGGNFGLVTRFRFNLHPLPSIYAGSIVYDGRGFREAMQKYLECCLTAPDEFTVSLVAATGPGSPRVSLDVCFAGEHAAGESVTNTLHPQASDLVLSDSRKRYSYVNWQRQLDDDARRGRRSYWRALYVEDMSSQRFLSLVERYLFSAPSPHSMLTVDHVHGASLRYGRESSAYGDRKHEFLFLINTNWDQSCDDEKNLTWCDDLYSELREFGTGTTYLNYLSEEGSARVAESFGENFSRLKKIKAKYDPANAFLGTQRVPLA